MLDLDPHQSNHTNPIAQDQTTVAQAEIYGSKTFAALNIKEKKLLLSEKDKKIDNSDWFRF